MFDIGFLELVLIGIIGLIVLGPERLPVAAKTLGKWVGRARRLVSQFSQEIDKEIEIEELKAKLKKQGESLNINEDVRKIQQTVSQALSEVEEDIDYGHAPHSGDFEPLPRKESVSAADENQANTSSSKPAEQDKPTDRSASEHASSSEQLK